MYNICTSIAVFGGHALLAASHRWQCLWLFRGGLSSLPFAIQFWSTQAVKRDAILARKLRSSSGGNDRSDLKAAELVLDKIFA
jgi:hypothetical protein